MITSRENIARLAEQAAAAWVQQHRAGEECRPPTNPFDAHAHPDHHRQFAAALERYLLMHSAPEGEASA